MNILGELLYSIADAEQSIQDTFLQTADDNEAGESHDDHHGDEDASIGDLSKHQSMDEVDVSSGSEMADEFPGSSDDDSNGDDTELAVEKKSKKLDKQKALDAKLAEAELQESAVAPEAIYELPTTEEMEEAPHDLQSVHQR